MMNKSKIEYCDFTYNPITGCLHDCPYCYARKQSKRFCGDIRLNKASPQLQRQGDLWILEKPFKNLNGKVVPFPVGFEPTLHRYRMQMPQKKKLPANIFVGSMADVFGEWIPDEWITEVFEACEAAPWHNYLFLTKNPKRYNNLLEKGLLPSADNFWYGSTTPTQGAPYWLDPHYRTFRSIEPLLGKFELFSVPLKYADWVIIGAETGNRKDKITPERPWIEAIVSNCKVTGTPVFMKDNLKDVWGKNLLREFPKQLTTPSWENRPVHKVFIESVREKKKCRQCKKSVQGRPAVRISARFYICDKCYKGESE